MRSAPAPSRLADRVARRCMEHMPHVGAFLSTIITLRIHARFAAEFQDEEPLLEKLIAVIAWALAFAFVSLGVDVANDTKNTRRAVFFSTTILITLLLCEYVFNGGRFEPLSKSTYASHAWPSERIATRILSTNTPTGTCRRLPLEKALSELRIPFETDFGLSYDDFNNTSQLLEAAGVTDEDVPDFESALEESGLSRKVNALAVVVTAVNLRTALALLWATQKTHALFLEDDAELQPHFVESFTATLKKYEDYDVVFLDTRSMARCALSGLSGGGTAGMVYNAKAIPQIINALHISGDIGLQMMRENMVPASDVNLVRACEMGRLKCACAPIVRERKVGSTREWLRKTA